MLRTVHQPDGPNANAIELGSVEPSRLEGDTGRSSICTDTRLVDDAEHRSDNGEAHAGECASNMDDMISIEETEEPGEVGRIMGRCPSGCGVPASQSGVASHPGAIEFGDAIPRVR